MAGSDLVTLLRCGTCGESYSSPTNAPPPDCPKCGTAFSKPEIIPNPTITKFKAAGNDHDWVEVNEGALGHMKSICQACGLETFEDARRVAMLVKCSPRPLDPDQVDAIKAAKNPRSRKTAPVWYQPKLVTPMLGVILILGRIGVHYLAWAGYVEMWALIAAFVYAAICIFAYHRLAFYRFHR